MIETSPTNICACPIFSKIVFPISGEPGISFVSRSNTGQDSLTTNDPLNNSNSRPWINFTSQHGFCKFTASGYLVSASANTVQNCIALGSDYSDFAMKLEMTILKGSSDGDVGGIF